MDKDQLASEIVRLGGVLESGLLVRGAKRARRLGVAGLLERFYEECLRDGSDPAEVIYRHWRPETRTSCVRCGSSSKFTCIRRGYEELCAACKESDRVAKITETKRRTTSEAGENLGHKKALATRRAKYGPSMMSSAARAEASRRMSGVRSRLKEYIGVENPSMLESVRAKKRQNAIAKYGVLHQQRHLTPEAVAMLKDEEYLASKSSIDIERETGISQSHLSKVLARHGLSPERSSLECSFHNWLDELGIPYRKNVRKQFEMREMDVVIDHRRLCVELNGLYWHSRIDDRNYHLDKTQAAERAGYRLFHVWEDDWRDRRAVVQSMIRSRLGMNTRVAAKSLVKREVSPAEANAFFSTTHLQGPSARVTEAYALFDRESVVSCIGIGRSRFSDGDELIRFASALDTTVVGGFTKMTSMVSRRPLKSYCRLDTSTGDGYTASGWRLVNRTKPGYWYTDGRERFNRMRFQKHLITSKDDPRPEWQIVSEGVGLRRVWDCGQLVFELT